MRRALSCVGLLAAVTVGCREEHTLPTQRPGGGVAASVSATTRELPAEALLHEVAREVPGFGGYYLDSTGMLVAFLTDTTRRGQLQTSLAELSFAGRLPKGVLQRGVSIRLGQFDFPSLARWRDLVTDRMLGVVPGVVATDADEAANRVAIGVHRRAHPGAAAEVMRLVAELGIPAHAVELIDSEPVRPTHGIRAGSPMLNQHLDDTPNPLMAGYLGRTSLHPPGTGCTFGPVVERNGQPMVMTASHCTAQTYAFDGQGIVTANDTLVGFEAVDPSPTCGSMCRYSDVALFHISGRPYRRGAIARTTDITYSWGVPGATAVDQSDPFRAVTQVLSSQQALVGTMVFKTGRATGTTGGTITHTCVHVEDEGGVTRKCSGKAKYYSDDGDSGAPVWSADGAQARLLGVHFGNNQSSSHSWFSHFSEAASELGGTINAYTDITVSPTTITGTIVAGYPSLTWTAATVTNSTSPTVYRLRRRTWSADSQSYTEFDADVLVTETQFSYTDYDRPVNLYYGSTVPPGTVDWVEYYILAANHGVTSGSNSVFFRRKNLF
jgi:hypothetical protein